MEHFDGAYVLLLPENINKLSLSGGSFNGALVYSSHVDAYAETKTSWIDFTATLTLAADFVDANNAKITIKLDRTGFEQANITANLTYTGSSLDLSYNTADESGLITVTDGEGIVMTLAKAVDATNVTDQGTKVGVIKLAGELFATIRDNGGIFYIVYLDGTFESLL